MTSSEGNANVNLTDGKSKEDRKTSVGQSSSPQQQPLVTPTSPSYPPYGATYIDPAQLAANGYDISDPNMNYTTYVYPLSPQFSVQYYPDYSNGYQSYPGSPALHPQSPPINPTSPPFSPTYQYQQGGGLTLSPPTHAAYMLPPHSAQPFPPLHISSPVLTGTSGSSSPPHQHYLPGPYIIATTTAAEHRKRHNDQQLHHQQQLQLQQQLEAELNSFHTHNIYVRGLSSSTTDDSFREMCQV